MNSTKARQVSPRNARPVKMSSQARLNEASRLFHEQGRAEEALKLCQFVLRTDVRSVSARELLSEIYVAQGQPHRAYALLEQALMLQPTNASLVRKLHQLNQSGGEMGAAAVARKAAPRSASMPLVGPTPSFHLSSRAVSMKHSVLGALWAYLTGRTLRGK